MGGIGLLIILIVIIKHIGASIRDGVSNSQSRREAMAKGEKTYLDFNCSNRNVDDNHKVVVQYSSIVGKYRWDFKSNKLYLDGLREFINKYNNKKNINTSEGTVWRGRVLGAQHDICIDSKTGELMLEASFYDPGNENKGPTRFYTDLWTRTKVIRKSDDQLSFWEKCGSKNGHYSLEEIRNNKGKDAYFSKYGMWKVGNAFTSLRHPLNVVCNIQSKPEVIV